MNPCNSAAPPMTYLDLQRIAEHFRSQPRDAAIWSCPYAPSDRVTILDTNALAPVDFHIPDSPSFPKNTLLVVLHPSYISMVMSAYQEVMLNSAFASLVNPWRDLAAMLIDSACKQNPTLSAKLGWR